MSNRVPAGWEAASFGDLCKFSGGSAFKEKYQGKGSGDYPFIKVSDMNIEGNQRFITKANHWIDQVTRLEAKVKLFPEPAVVFAKVGAALLLNRRRILTRETAIDNNMMAAIPFEDGHNFLYYALQEVDLGEIVQGGAVPSVNQAQMEDIPLLIPPLPEQQKIATILSSVDDVIEKTRAQIDKLKDLKTGMMQELLTKGIGSGGVPHTVFKDSPVGRVPEDWTVCALDHVVKGIIDCEHKTAPYVESSEYLVVRTTNVRHGQLIYEDMKFTTRSGFSEWTKRAVPSAGDVLFTREAPAGESCMVPGGVKICMGQRMVLLRPDTDIIYPFFFSLFLTSETAKLAIYELSIGTTVTRINIEDIRRIPCVVPPLEEQKAIYSKIQSIQSLITSKQEKLRSQSNVKKALMQDLLTGKVRVKVDQKESAVA